LQLRNDEACSLISEKIWGDFLPETEFSLLDAIAKDGFAWR
jgi:hypothetical protein